MKPSQQIDLDRSPRPEKRRWRWFTLALLAALVVLASVIVGLLIGNVNGNQSTPMADASSRFVDRSPSAASGPTVDTPGRPDSNDPPRTAGPQGTDSAEQLLEVIRLANVAVGGDVSDLRSVEAEPVGAWHVHFETADGLESKVRVVDDKATIIETERSDDGRFPGTWRIEDINSAVLAALAAYPGSYLTELELDASSHAPYRIELVDGSVHKLRLDTNFQIVEMRLDD
ncbi:MULTISPECIES: hypothetical protein [unclassified Plantibacter]|uniref:hypothetical protein n=1 Tax=unclassified Plantibacter TaxID=2624265 RepID=UPI00177E8668|nr:MULTISPECIES: hypothetical protein [unclassified Plantibacter]MBD8519125.1 hypothetical protein [Plantibacter sp. CFBP 8804]MBD8535598.1 hypothetical protein [Plantibacter sp. CFBP 13570]